MVIFFLLHYIPISLIAVLYYIYLGTYDLLALNIYLTNLFL